MAVDEEKLPVNMLIVAVQRESKINYQFAKTLIAYEKSAKLLVSHLYCMVVLQLYSGPSENFYPLK